MLVLEIPVICFIQIQGFHHFFGDLAAFDQLGLCFKEIGVIIHLIRGDQSRVIIFFDQELGGGLVNRGAGESFDHDKGKADQKN